MHSRDALAEGLDILTNVITDIYEGRFKPDAPRNQRWVKAPMVPSEENQEADLDGDEVLIPEHKWDMLEMKSPGKPTHRLVELAEVTSESSEEESEDRETQDERNLEAVVTAKLGPPKKATAELYRHGLTVDHYTLVLGLDVIPK